MQMSPTLTDFGVVVFDFDGVLVESVEVKTTAFAKLYQPYGDGIRDQVVAHHLSHGGMSRYEKFRHWHRTFLGVELTADELADLAQRFAALVEDEVVAAAYVEGAIDLLEQWSKTRALFIASATPQDELRRIVERRDLKQYFVESFGSPRRKGAVLAELATRTGRDSRDLLMIGDSLSDYEASVEAHTSFIGRVRRGDSNPFPTPVRTITALGELLKT